MNESLSYDILLTKTHETYTLGRSSNFRLNNKNHNIFNIFGRTTTKPKYVLGT